MFDPRTIPALDAYLSRIKAEVLNFRKFIVREYFEHYYTERAIIAIVDGDIVCSKPECAPTDEERESIRISLRGAAYPTCIQFHNYDELLNSLGAGVELYEFWDRKTDKMVMLQEVRRPKGIGKAYVPHTLWSDGAWRTMEPEQALPFWKPRKKRDQDRLMIHEGAKSAAFVDSLVNDPERANELRAHPFGEDLRLYEHWAIIGGALSPHRADYSEIRNLKWKEVIYVCDNDKPGNSVLQEFSRHYGKSMMGIRFDERWKEGFDFADPFPRSLYVKERYIGPTFNNLVLPATWATEKQEDEDGKQRLTLRKDFKDEWYHAIRPEVFVHARWPDIIWSAKEFNSKVKPYSHSANTALLLQGDDSSKTGVLKYSPAYKGGIYNSADGGRFINTHVPSTIVAEEGDVSPFLEFMQHLVRDEGDCTELMRWCATLIARPEVKMQYGVLLISEVQGVGKGTLGEKILAPLIGAHNVSYPSESSIVESLYNDWIAHKRLAIIHEIYAGHSAKAYNRLKSVVTDRYIQVEQKYTVAYALENWCHIFACSNSMRAIQLSADDRRWFVPKITDEKRPAAYWDDFNKWLVERGGINMIRWWADDFLRNTAPVVAGEPAPKSKIKDEIIEEGYSPGQALVARAFDELNRAISGEDEDLKTVLEKKGYLKKGEIFLFDTQLTQLIKDKVYEGRHSDKLERPATVRKIAKLKGWHVSDHRPHVKQWGHYGARLICSSPQLAKTVPSTLCSEKMEPKDRRLPVDLNLVVRM